MAKRFLDALGEAFDDDVLDDVIPPPRRKASGSRRKKRFRDSLSEKIPEEEGSFVKPPKRKTASREAKSLLDTMEEALDNQVFDSLFPERPQRPPADQLDPPKLESPFSTMITTDVLQRAREIAIAKGIRVKDVINMALSLYVNDEWEKVNSKSSRRS
ncbi:MAG: hypothetical protein D6722_23900 [Bacteroidetes bacterium]|nr:MAG: hypothetical protein D6722_23900 [Bacteroidota bacterium]